MEERNKYKPLTVLMTTDTIGGVWVYSVELCKALEPLNVHFYLVTMGAPMQLHQQQEIKKLQNVTVYETCFLLEWMEDPWQSIDEAGTWLLQLEQELKPGLIHLNGYTHGSLAWQAPVVMVAHSDVFSWWAAVKKTYPPLEWNEYYERLYSGLQQADYIIAPSKTVLKEVCEMYAVTTPCKVIYNGRRPGIFYAAQKQPIACSVGRIWDEAKNIRLLVAAAKHIPCTIQLAGDSSFGKDSCTATGRNVITTGKLPESKVAAMLSVAAIYVLPAKYEPFGLSILEAALSGCALILGNISSLKEIWGDAALYVDTDSPLQLAGKVNHLLQNEQKRMYYAAKALKKAKSYSAAAMATGYMEVYQQLTTSRHLVKQQQQQLT